MKKLVMHKVKDCKSCSKYEAPGADKLRGKDRLAITSLWLNSTFGSPMPDIIEVTITPGVKPPSQKGNT